MRILKHFVGRALNRNRIKFVMLFVGRSGSTYLMDGIDSHPNIQMEGEVFDTSELDAKSKQRWRFRRCFYARREKNIQAVGFKTKLKEMYDEKEFAKLLHSYNCKIIHCQRKNLVKLAVSEINSKIIHKNTLRWNLDKSEARMKRARINSDHFAKILKQKTERANELSEFVRDLKLPVLEIFYEDILQEEEGVFKRIFNFIGVPYAKPTTRTRKATSDNLRDALVNFDELRSIYEATEYRDMFDEVLIK